MIVLAAVAAGCGGGKPVTARCDAATAELRFEPSREVRVRMAGAVVAEVDTGSRRIDLDACPRVRTQRAWHTNRKIYRKTRDATLLHCRFRDGFFVHVHPTSSSEAGESYDGSALYLVIGAEPTIIASASVGPHASYLLFSPRHCTQSPG
jgi:hypothetical protein